MDDETPPSPTSYWVRRRREQIFQALQAPSEGDVTGPEAGLTDKRAS